jgi:hypothetical protein
VLTHFGNEVASRWWILLARIAERIPVPALRFTLRLGLRRVGYAGTPGTERSGEPYSVITAGARRLRRLVGTLNDVTATVSLNLHKAATRW